MPRVNYEVPRLSKLHEDARNCPKDFQQVLYELEMFKVCRRGKKEDQYGVLSVEKVENFI